MKEDRSSELIAKILMWIGWAFLIMGCIMFSIFLPANNETTNSFSRPLGVFELGMMIAPVGSWMAWRFGLLPRIRNPWIQMVLFGIGVFFSQQIMLYGIFLVPEYQVVFYGLCAASMLAYLPLWIHPNRSNKARLDNPLPRPESKIES
jgi:hypothetical protein